MASINSRRQDNLLSGTYGLHKGAVFFLAILCGTAYTFLWMDRLEIGGMVDGFGVA